MSSSTSTTTPNNLAADLKPRGQDGTTQVKPCCVCKEEKSRRDECILFSTAVDPQTACEDLVGKYKLCMKGHGFNI